MANTVGTEEVVELQDGTEVTLRPLVIKRLKMAMAYLDQSDDRDGEDPLDFLLGLVQICIEKQVGKDFDYEEAIDTPTAKRIILVGTGIDFDDSANLILAATQAAQSGKTSTSES